MSVGLGDLGLPHLECRGVDDGNPGRKRAGLVDIDERFARSQVVGKRRELNADDVGLSRAGLAVVPGRPLLLVHQVADGLAVDSGGDVGCACGRGTLKLYW